jgi:predicted O-methyltransferase YrrM
VVSSGKAALRDIDDVVAAMRSQEWGVTEEQGRLLFDFILREKPRFILELGCGIGTSALYISAALEHLGQGRVLSIDRNPDLPDWVARTFAKLDPELRRFHELIVSQTSYNDELMRLISKQTRDGRCEPLFDFCFIDGAHTWETDSCAFFLAEKLLKPGSWILFDDLTWTIAGSAEAMKHGVGENKPLDLIQSPQVMRIFEFCVCQHPGFDSFTITNDWGWARKKADNQPAAASSVARLFAQQNSTVTKLRRFGGRFLRKSRLHENHEY